MLRLGTKGLNPTSIGRILLSSISSCAKFFKVLIVFGRQAEDHIDLHLHKPDRLSARAALDVLVFCFSAHDPAQARRGAIERHRHRAVAAAKERLEQRALEPVGAQA